MIRCETIISTVAPRVLILCKGGSQNECGKIYAQINRSYFRSAGNGYPKRKQLHRTDSSAALAAVSATGSCSTDINQNDRKHGRSFLPCRRGSLRSSEGKRERAAHDFSSSQQSHSKGRGHRRKDERRFRLRRASRAGSDRRFGRHSERNLERFWHQQKRI